ncbi:TPA: hypothetical protein ACH3X2_014084 [Trebouxia sp. C0005]|nr:MAG: SIN3 component of histone deacetylase complex [Trebouxia sp. A1-2]
MKRGYDAGPPGGGKRPVSHYRGEGAAMAGGPGVQGANRLTTSDALSYLREVKNRFSNNKHIYDTFLEIMKEFKAQRINTEGVIHQVKMLFHGHIELILGFNTFLPKGYEITMQDLVPEEDKPKQPVEFDQAINYVNKIKTRFATDERVYKAFLEILNMYRKGQKNISNVYDEVALLFRSHDDLLQEFTYFLPDSSVPQGQQTQHPAFQHVVNPRGAPNRHQVRGGVKPGAYPRAAVYDSGYRNVNKRKATRRGDDQIPYGCKQEDPDYPRVAAGGIKPTNLSKELQFFEKVKQRMRNREQYQDFLKCLSLFSEDIISKHELLNLIVDSLSRHPDLQDGFQDFVNRCEGAEFEDSVLAQQGKMSLRDLQKMRQSAGNQYATKPASELAMDNRDAWERCTKSYARLPDAYPRLKCSGRDDLGRSVLNDEWVSVTTGSEDYSFKLMRKNQYEEALFRAEDDRFELDMVIECGASTIQRLQPLAEKLLALEPDERANFRIPDGVMGPVHYRAVQKIYGEQGHQIVELVKKNPGVAIPVVLSRLQQKDGEWRRVKQDMKPLFSKVFQQNYHKSLDHRSFYFKQTDKKQLGHKAMIQEIKEVAEKRRSSDADLLTLSVAAPYVTRIAAELTYDYKDRMVHDDVYKIIKYTVQKTMSGELAQRALDWWAGLVEHLFGLPARTPEQEKAVVPAAEDHSERNKTENTTTPEGWAKLDHADSGEAPNMMDEGELPVDANGEFVSGVPVDPDDPRTANMKPAGKTSPPARNMHPGSISQTEAGDMETDGIDSDDDDNDVLHKSDQHMVTEATETNSEDTGDSEGAVSKAYARFKPVTGVYTHSAAARQDGEPETSGNGAERGRVFYGHDGYYVFFRLHQCLYERLRQAHKCSQQCCKPAYARPNDIETGGGEVAVQDDEAAKQIHSQFMQMALQLVDGRLDSSQYEDSCRQLLGTNSYVLFTLDKLIAKVMKAFQGLMQDPLACKLFDMYKYECSRSVPFADAVYHANTHVVLHEDHCFRLQSQPDGQLNVQLLDPDKTEVPASIVETQFAEYLSSLTDIPATLETTERDSAGKPRRPFMLRTLPTKHLAELEELLPEALSNTMLVNGLECKLNNRNSKVSYVIETSDAFLRQKRRRQDLSFLVAARARKFHNWYSQHEHTMIPAYASVLGI